MDLPVWRLGAEAQQLLASALGDGGLLDRWRRAQPDENGPCSAPPAAIFEEEVEGGSLTGYAAAALAGLPEDDEAVQLARMAAGAGRSLQEVVAWSYSAGDHTSTMLYSRGRGRVSAPGQQEPLYREMSSWADPTGMAAQLAAAASARKRRLTPAEVAEARRAKQESKRAKQRAWLYT